MITAHRVRYGRVHKGCLHAGDEGFSRRPGAHCSVLCESISGDQKVCDERLEDLHGSQETKCEVKTGAPPKNQAKLSALFLFYSIQVTRLPAGSTHTQSGSSVFSKSLGHTWDYADLI